MTMEMHNIEQLTREHKAARDVLSDRILDLQAEVDSIKRRRINGIKAALAKVAETHEAVKVAIEANPQLFVKPRTAVFYGVKVGFRKGKGGIDWDDDNRVIELIRKHLPDLAEVLIKTEETPVKNAMQELDAQQLKKIGCRVVDSGDEVFIKPVDSDINKMINAWLKDWEKEEAADAKASAKGAAA